MDHESLWMLPEEAARWRALEKEGDPCLVVTRRMQVVFLNGAARAMAPLRWFGCHCWEILEVGEEDCATRCETVREVLGGGERTTCHEETVFGRDGLPVEMDVAVIPIPAESGGTHERAVLLFRRRAESGRDLSFREKLLHHGEELRARIAAARREGMAGMDFAPAPSTPSS